MPKRSSLSSRGKEFIAASNKGDLPLQIASARAFVRAQILLQGIDLTETTAHVEELLGADIARTAQGEISWDTYCDWLSAAFAIGVACGQLFAPETFTDGGEK
jgi:hypothetical protein